MTDCGGGVIYGLFDPRTDEIRYVGKTCREPTTRLRKHVSRALAEDAAPSHKNNWIRELVASGSKPVMKTMQECCTYEQLCQAEISLIAELRSSGARLTNITEGGDGARGVTVSNEVRQKIRAAFVGRPLSPEHRRRISEARRGHTVSPETREKIRQAALAMSSETRAKIAAAGRGRKHSPEARVRMSDALRERWKDPVARSLMTEGVTKAWADRTLRSEQSARVKLAYAARRVEV